ncbi:hypothetical protein [Deinococcus indicus]|uniref:hypothetical protein n=1 Tax=Deinococcus indicus TaxID=223556 RepID=UPI00117767AF|nr:hypothetical protein [Deinococcus indicus]
MISPHVIAAELERRAADAHAACISADLLLDALHQLGDPHPEAGLRRVLADLMRPPERGLPA